MKGLAKAERDFTFHLARLLDDEHRDGVRMQGTTYVRSYPQGTFTVNIRRGDALNK